MLEKFENTIIQKNVKSSNIADEEIKRPTFPKKFIFTIPSSNSNHGYYVLESSIDSESSIY